MLKKGDFVVFSIIIAISILLLLFSFRGKAEQITVTVDGENYGSYQKNRDRTVKIETEYGENTLIIKGGKAHITKSDCPDKTCEKTGEINKAGETIVCLPHKVVVEVTE